MSDTDFYACTADDPSTLTGHYGLLGPGHSPWLGATGSYGSGGAPLTLNLGGKLYPADCSTAPRYLIAELKYDDKLRPNGRLHHPAQLQQTLRDAETTAHQT